MLRLGELTWRRQLVRQGRHLKWLVALVWLLGLGGGPLGAWRVGPNTFALLLAISVVAGAAAIWVRWQREVALREAALPQFLKRKLRETYPHLSGKDCELVERGLRQFFYACLRSERKFVAMPSRAVDAMWHEFILHTRAYREWCELTLGWFLHHTPAEALGTRSRGREGLRRAWVWACRDESIHPRHPTRLPLLFALDGKLRIPNGFSYVPDCRDIARKDAQGGDGSTAYCGSELGAGSGDGSSSDASGGWGHTGSGCGGDGGDGGGGCGGD